MFKKSSQKHAKKNYFLIFGPNHFESSMLWAMTEILNFCTDFRLVTSGKLLISEF